MTNNKHGFLLPDGCNCVVCALSGGADSVYLLKKVAEESHLRGIRLIAAHYNHGLRGAESDADEKFAKELCFAAGISFVSGKGDVLSYANRGSSKSTSL